MYTGTTIGITLLAAIFLSFEICLPMHVSMPYKFLVNTVGCLTCRCQNVYSGYEKSAIQEAWHNTFLVSWL